MNPKTSNQQPGLGHPSASHHGEEMQRSMNGRNAKDKLTHRATATGQQDESDRVIMSPVLPSLMRGWRFGRFAAKSAQVPA
jgi:hypothetical protein